MGIALLIFVFVMLIFTVFAMMKVAKDYVSNKSLREASMEMAIEISSSKNLEEIAGIIENGVKDWLQNK
jgi:predicted house-cleaning noncanonical NTP pyrophosphatase (MazG superfamily)